jgi:glycosyltransferase involved in cell wall biosynthesis
VLDRRLSTNDPHHDDPVPTERPRLSVIVSSWNREEFLPEALASVGAQRLDPERDEVLLNSNLPDASVRRIIGDRPIRPLRNEENAQGAFYAAAVRAARGEVLAFLDDDDRWAPGRMEAASAQFARSPSLAYFHNEQRRIDASGATILKSPTAVRLSRRPVAAPTGVPGPVRDAALQSLVEHAAFFNLSSTCVRAASIAPYLGYLERITTSDDSFFFYACILSGGGFFLDPHPWTDYRVHQQNFSRRWDRASRGGVAGSWPMRAVESHDILHEMATDAHRQDVTRCVERDLAMMRLLWDVAREPSSRKTSGQDLLALLRRFSVGHLPLNVGFATLGAAEVISPTLGRYVHGRLRK